MEKSNQTNTRLKIIILITVGLLITSACGEPPKIHQMDIVISEWAIEPQSEILNAGLITFNVTNNGALEHNFIIESREGESIELIFTTETKTLEIELEPGTYTLICNLPGHQEAGMETAITVAP